jgi:hypothetical protein
MIQFRSLKPLARKIKTAQSHENGNRRLCRGEKHLSNFYEHCFGTRLGRAKGQFIEGKRQSGEKKEPLDSFVKKAHNMCTLFVYTMKTKKVGLRDFRKNLGNLVKKGKDENIIFYITSRNKAVGEFRPCFNDKSEFDDTDIVHLQYLEQDLSFWDSEDDDDIFENQ